MVVNYWKVNDITIKYHYTMANAETKLDKLKSKKVFTKFNIRVGYNNIIIEPEDQCKAAFKMQISTYIPQVMPFKLCNAPSLFQRATNWNFRVVKQKYLNNFTHFMDDMCIGTRDSEKELVKHCQIIHEVLDLFEKHSYFLKLSKCVFEAWEIKFLRFQIGHGVASINHSKMDRLHNWLWILNSVKVQQVLGVLGYQWAFIQDLVTLAQPLTWLTKKGVPFEWTFKSKEALDKLITKVMEDPKLVAPNPKKQYELKTDASNFTLRAVLFQWDE